MFKNLLRSMTTIVLLAVVVLIQIIIVFQNNNIESQNIAAKKLAENAPTTVQTVVASGDSNIKGMYAPYAFAFDDPKQSVDTDSEEWLPEDATKSGVLLSYLTSDPKGLNFLTKWFRCICVPKLHHYSLNATTLFRYHKVAPRTRIPHVSNRRLLDLHL